MKEIKLDKIEELINNLENGNITQFREEIKKLNKYDLIEFIRYIIEIYGEQNFNIFTEVKRALKW